LRQGFICTFKCDKYWGLITADWDVIDDGNHGVHSGDNKADAFLYCANITGRRVDGGAFENLYRFLPEIVEELSKS